MADVGLDLAVRETALDYDIFPNGCPYAIEQILDAASLPSSEQKQLLS